MLSNLAAGDLIILFIAMLLAVSTHEAMHAFAAHALGDSTAKDQGRLTLNPLKHIDIITTVLLPVILIALGLPAIFIAKPVPFDPDRVNYGEFGAALMALAGPFTNLVLAVITALLLRLGGASLNGEFVHALIIFVQVNIALFVFNMIPLPPLDGSRLLYAFAPEPLQRIMYQIEAAGFGVTILIFLLLSSFIVPLITNISRAILTFLL
jgi:Zn-dependent protease